MENKHIENNNEIRYVSENEREELQNYINKYNKKLRRRNEVISSIIHSLKYIFFTPLSIAANVTSIVFKIGGSITAIGIPYGIFCAYKTIEQLHAGVTFHDIKQTTFVCLFVIFPFAAFFFSLVFEKLSNYLSDHR